MMRYYMIVVMFCASSCLYSNNDLFEYVLNLLYGDNKEVAKNAPLDWPFTLVMGHKTEELKIWLEDHPRLVNQPDAYGVTLLMWAVVLGYEDMVTLLLWHGADGSIVSKTSIAVRDVIRALLKKTQQQKHELIYQRIDLLLEKSFLKTQLLNGIHGQILKNNYYQLLFPECTRDARCVIDNNYIERTPLERALVLILCRDTDGLRVWLARHNNLINEFDECGTLLMYAAALGYEDIVGLLLLHNADPSLANASGNNVIDIVTNIMGKVHVVDEQKKSYQKIVDLCGTKSPLLPIPLFASSLLVARSIPGDMKR